MELPALEDIYDFDERTLDKYQEAVAEALKAPPDEKFERKARRVLEVIEIELYERVSINQIALFCSKELNSELFNEIVQEQEPPSTEASEDARMEKMWQMKRNRNKRGYQDYIKGVLKNTQQSKGIVIGASSVVAKPPPKQPPKSEPKPEPKKPPTMPRPNKLPPKRHSTQPVDTKPAKEPPRPAKRTQQLVQEPVNKGAVQRTGAQSLKVSSQVSKDTPKELPKVSSDEGSEQCAPVAELVDLDKPTELTEPAKLKESAELQKPAKLQEPSELQEPAELEEPAELQGPAELNEPAEVDEPSGSDKPAELDEPAEFKQVADRNVERTMSQPIEQAPESPVTQTTDLSDFHVQPSAQSRHAEPVLSGTGVANTHSVTPPGTEEVKVSQTLHEDPTHYDKRSGEVSIGRPPSFPDKQVSNSKDLQKKSDNSSGSLGNQKEEPSSEFADPILTTRTTSGKSSQEGADHTTSGSLSKREHKTDDNFYEKLRLREASTAAAQESQKETDELRSANYQKLESLRQIIKQKQEAASKLDLSEPKPKPTEASKPAPKPVVPRKAEPKPKPVAKASPPVPIPNKNVTDYSQIYANFYDIFSGSKVAKDFNALVATRDVLSIFKEFLTTISTPDFEFQRKFKLSLAPLELNPRDIVSGAHQELLQPGPTVVQEKYFRVVKARAEVYDIVTRSFSKQKGWTELPHGMNLKSSWNLMWTWSKPAVDMSKLLVWQKVNHFPETKNFSRKDLLKNNIEKIKRLSGKCCNKWNIIPATYSLPKEYVKFVDDFDQQEEICKATNIWIMKPIGKSRGRGISVVNDLSQVTYGEPMVIQRYIANPLLLNQFKFDLRLYVLITSFNPLEAFLYQEGFARMSTMPYTTSSEKLHNKYIHLTNSSIQKHSQSEGLDPVEKLFGGTKICLETLKERLVTMGINWVPIWEQIREVVVKSLIAVQNNIPSYPCCFDLVGYDVLIDENLKVWLIEINSSPSLARDNFLDDLIKQRLIDDTLALINPQYFNIEQLVKVLERRHAELVKGQTNNSLAQMNADLTRVLEGQLPRRHGQVPEELGKYEQIAPSPLYEKFHRMAYPRYYAS